MQLEGRVLDLDFVRKLEGDLFKYFYPEKGKDFEALDKRTTIDYASRRNIPIHQVPSDASITGLHFGMKDNPERYEVHMAIDKTADYVNGSIYIGKHFYETLDRLDKVEKIVRCSLKEIKSPTSVSH